MWPASTASHGSVSSTCSMPSVATRNAIRLAMSSTSLAHGGWTTHLGVGRSRGFASVAAMTDAHLSSDQTVAVLGGTGPQGRGLARRFAAAGLTVVIGSRTAEAEATAAELAEATGRAVTGATTRRRRGRRRRPRRRAVGRATASCSRRCATALAGKVVVDCVNPLGFDKQGAYALDVEEGSAAQQAAALLPESHRRRRLPQRQRRAARGPRRRPRSTPTSSCSATTARPPTSSRRSRDIDPRRARACTAAGCATPTRSRPSPPT